MRERGVAHARDYPYKGKVCNSWENLKHIERIKLKNKGPLFISGHGTINGMDAMSRMLAFHPIVGSVHFHKDDDSFYRLNQTIFRTPDIPLTLEDYSLNIFLKAKSKEQCFLESHSILIVGVQYVDGEDMWVVQNTWGEEWGDQGFGYIPMTAAGFGVYGINMRATYPIIDNECRLQRSTGHSHGFGYVTTFASVEDAKNALSGEHFLGSRMLEVKIATTKEEMKASSKRVTRIFVARIPPSVPEAAFRSYFETYGDITDLYMPKDPSTKGHRGIGFITFARAESVDNLMVETHELGGSTIVVDRATPKEDDFIPIGRMAQSGYGAYNAYMTTATRCAALGAPTLYDHPSSYYGRGESTRGRSRKIFVGRLPQEASAEDLLVYFGRFGHILDAYVPKNPKRTGHRGFGFVTFADDGVADRVARRPQEICGQQVTIDSATLLDDVGTSGPSMADGAEQPESFGGYDGPMHTYGRMYRAWILMIGDIVWEVAWEAGDLHGEIRGTGRTRDWSGRP